jgi:hypothetical protein
MPGEVALVANGVLPEAPLPEIVLASPAAHSGTPRQGPY